MQQSKLDFKDALDSNVEPRREANKPTSVSGLQRKQMDILEPKEPDTETEGESEESSGEEECNEAKGKDQNLAKENLDEDQDAKSAERYYSMDSTDPAALSSPYADAKSEF